VVEAPRDIGCAITRTRGREACAHPTVARPARRAVVVRAMRDDRVSSGMIAASRQASAQSDQRAGRLSALRRDAWSGDRTPGYQRRDIPAVWLTIGAWPDLVFRFLRDPSLLADLCRFPWAQVSDADSEVLCQPALQERVRSGGHRSRALVVAVVWAWSPKATCSLVSGQ